MILTSIFNKENFKFFFKELLILVGVMVVCLYTVIALYIFTPLAFLFVVPLIIAVLYLLPKVESYPENFLRTLILVYFPLTIVWPYFIGINIGFMDLHPSRVLLLFIVLLWMYYFISSPNFREQLLQYKYVSSVFFIALWVFLFTHVSGIGFSNYPIGSINGVFKVLTEIFVPTFLFLILVNTREMVEKFINVFIVLGVLVMIVGVWESFVKAPFWGTYFSHMILADLSTEIGIWRNGVYRVTSIFRHPLVMVQFQIIVISMMAYRTLSVSNFYVKLLLLMAMLGTVYVMFASDSRSIVPALFLMSAILLSAFIYKVIQTNKSGFIGWLFTALFPIIAIGGTVAFYASRQMFMGSSDIATLSTEARYDMWGLAWQRILDNPLAGFFGYGLQTSTEVVNWRGGVSLDSYFINVLIEQGVNGFVLFLLIYIYTVWLAVKLWRNSNYKDILPIFLIIALTGYIVIAFISSLTHILHLYYLLIAMVWVLSLTKKRISSYEKY